MAFTRPARLVVMVSCVAMATLLMACSSSAGEGAGSGTGSTEATAGAAPDDTSSDRAVDGVAALHLEGKVDRIVAMLPPGPATRPPVGMFPDATLLAARHVLRAPTPDGFVELWILRVRSPDMGPGIVECRVTESAGSSGASCSPIADAQAQPDDLPLVGGGSGDGSSIVVELNGPPDMTHFVVTTPTGTIGVVPIEGQALLYIDEACPDDTTVAAWRGEEQIREEPAVFC